MPPSIVARYGILQEKTAEQPGMEVWTVDIAGESAQAVVYPALVGTVMPGDRVLLNAVAVELGLGTGGQHFVIARVDADQTLEPIRRENGHVIKLRYTPLQLRVLAVEEEASPHHEQLCKVDSLPGTPVICLGLHSQLAPAAGGVKAANPDLRVAYVMTDSAALPLAYSRLVHQLVEAGLLNVTITTGQAFGGDLEAVNVYSGMVAAGAAGEADVIITGQGPGNVGTATALGFGGIEQAALINAASALGGHPIAVPRISFADPRARHRGISHHTVTVLGRLALADTVIPLPILPDDIADEIRVQIEREGLTRHRLITVDGEPGIVYCRQHGIALNSMGREYEDDPVFFQAASAAGAVAARLIEDQS